MFDFAGYPVDVGRALESVGPLAAFFSQLIASRPAGRLISFVGHSLGCRLIADVMCQPGVASPAGPTLAIVSLMAAAVPVALVEAGQRLAGVPAAAVKVLKAHSRSDWVLWLAFPAGQFGAWLAGNEAAAYVEAVGRNGNPAGFGESLLREGNGHSDYWTDEYAAAVLLVTMDATLRALPPPAEIPPHGLPPLGEIPTRELKSRELPP
jgi:xanthosine utilization system XapX-like protein